MTDPNHNQSEEAHGDWEWNEEDFLTEEEEEGQAPPQRKWIKRIILALVALALAGNLLAIIPLIYNSNVLAFLKKTRELSQNETIQKYKQAIVIVDSGNRKGTGFNMDERGIIVTNHHVVEGRSTAVVGFPDDRVFHASVIASDPEEDLAVLRLVDPPEAKLPVLEVDATPTWSVGMPIYYIGNPLFFNHIVGEGTVLGLTAIEDKPMPVLMIDAPIYKGNSGSPVINPDGNVIAVIYATMEILQRNGQRVKAGLAIPTDHPYFAKDAFQE